MGYGTFAFVPTPQPQYVKSREQAERWAELLYENGRTEGIGFDTETTGLSIVRDRVKFFSLAQHDIRICAPVRLLPVFADLLADPDIPKRMTNAKYDMHLALNHGVHVRGECFDTVDMDFLLDENRRGQHGLKKCAADYLGLRMTPFKQLFGDVGKVENEIKVLAEVHDILEQYDNDNEREAARTRAIQLMIRLQRVDASEGVLKALKKLELGIRSGFTLKYPVLLKFARDLGYAKKTAGKGGFVGDFVEFLLGIPVPKEDRDRWRPVLTNHNALQDFHTLLWERLLTEIHVQDDPIEQLRTIISDYASLDAWASHQLVEYLRQDLEEEPMITEGKSALEDAYYSTLGILDHHVARLKKEDPGSETLGRVQELTTRTEAKLARLEGQIERGVGDVDLYTWVREKRNPFTRTLWNMERRGFKISTRVCQEYSDDMQDTIDEVKREIVRVTQDLSFNPDSSPQVLEHLFSYDEVRKKWSDPWGNAPKKMTSGGASGRNKRPTTDKGVLEEFSAKGHALASLILRHRRFSKLKSTYMDGLPPEADRRGRIHSTLKATGARTWRLSSANPNLQNIPVRDPEWGPKIRNLFIAGHWGDCDPAWALPHLMGVPVPDLPPDFPMTLLVADYKQVEMRVMAHFSQDPGLIEAIMLGRDLHCQTVALASEIGALRPGITYEMAAAAKKAGKGATPEQLELQRDRSNLKATGFGILYGIGAAKLGMQLGLPVVPQRRRNGHVYDTCPAAEKLIYDYLNNIYPEVGNLIQRTHHECAQRMEVRTIAGHPRRLPDIRSRDQGLRKLAERQSVNSRIQGSAADITNEAMLRVEGDEELRRLGARMLMQVHDELILEVPDHPDFIAPAMKRVKACMTDPIDLLVPLEVDLDVAKSWGMAK